MQKSTIFSLFELCRQRRIQTMANNGGEGIENWKAKNLLYVLSTAFQDEALLRLRKKWGEADFLKTTSILSAKLSTISWCIREFSKRCNRVLNRVALLLLRGNLVAAIFVGSNSLVLRNVFVEVMLGFFLQKVCSLFFLQFNSFSS